MIAIVSSHTGGHLYPGVAIQQILKCPVLFLLPHHPVCERVVATYALDAHFFKVSKKPLRLLLQIFAFIRFFKQKKINQLIATGGGACLAAIVAAKCLKIPVTLCEQNVLPGRLNRYLSVLAHRVITSFEESKLYFINQKPIRCWGNPIRKHYAVSEPQKQIILPDQRECWAILGGSQGAWQLNRWAEDKLYESVLASDKALIHIVGESYYAHKKYSGQFVRLKGSEGEVLIVANWEAMDLLYQRITAIICRAGASTLAELLHFKVPSLLVPYPYAKDNHQQLNAEWMLNRGYAKCLSEKCLLDCDSSLLDKAEYEKMRAQLHLGPNIQDALSQNLRIHI